MNSNIQRLIDKRLRGIAIRQELLMNGKRGVEEQREFVIQ